MRLDEVPFYFQSANFQKIVREYPPAPDFFKDLFKRPPDYIKKLQEKRLHEAVQRAAQVPFYKRLWKNTEVDPSKIRTIEDLRALPTYTVDDIRKSVELAPPFGDYLGLDPLAGELPLRIHSSGGTSGEPRPTFYTPWDREIGSIMRARSYYFHGLRPGDMVMNTLLYSTHNGAFAVHEALWFWLGCTPVTTSAGVVTRTRRALEIAQKWKVNVIIGFPEYLLHMAQEAREMGIEIGKDLNLKVIDSFGKSDLVRDAWGCPAYDTYGMHEVQTISSECPYGGGHHIWEDGFIVEVVDPDTGVPVEDGREGSIVLTVLYKDAYPIIRYDTKDLTRLWDIEKCECGSWMRKMDPILGRADFMIKLRGINVWPEGCGAILASDGRLTGEYYCVVETIDGRDEMVVYAEHKPGITALKSIEQDLEDNMRSKLGVKIALKLSSPDSLSSLTGLGVLPKPRRLDDRRTSKPKGGQ